MSELPPVSIIIPNFNGATLLRNNLPFVLDALECYPGGGRVIVVDDGSVDDSLHVVSQQFPQVLLEKHPTNLGFAEAIHSGVVAAESDALVFLNSDVRPEPNFIEPLIRCLREDGVFSVQSAIREESGNIHPYCLTRFRFRLGALKRLKTLDLGRQPWWCLYASGGSMAVDKTKFNALGGFLPIFKPFYWEDFDLGVRAWRRGWRTLLEPTSVVLHQERGSIQDNVKRQRVRRALQRNKLLAEWIHFPVSTLAIFMLPRLLLRILMRTSVGDFGIWAALFGALGRVPEVLATRRSIQMTAQQGFRDVLRGIEQENARHGQKSS
jgi:GT2 family glycosyltransferase